MKRFTANQKFRVIIGQACFYSNAKTIRSGIGDFTATNEAVRKALVELEVSNFGVLGDPAVRGLAGIWNGINVQLDVA